MTRAMILAAVALACVVGPANARHAGGVSGRHGYDRPDGRTGNESRTYDYTTGTYLAWSKSGGKNATAREYVIYPASIEAHSKGGAGGHSRAPSRAGLDALAAEHSK